MPNTARVFARLMDWGKPAGAPADGALTVRLEYSLLDGSRVDGKFHFDADPLSTRNRLTNDSVDALVDHLNTLYPLAGYNDRDVVLWGS